jgi:acyl-CoA reductase-like NAD-dependent aldehyde dehydrogenase
MDAATADRSQDPAPTDTPQGGGKIAVPNPGTGGIAGEVDIYSREQVAGVVERCREAQEFWGALSSNQRGTMLRRYRDFLLDARDEIAETVAAETGKPLAEFFAAEMMYVCDGIGYWSKNAGRYLADRRFRPHLLKTKLPMTTYKPRGVIGMITPWNFPFLLSIGEAIPALMAGNGVVIKPSSTTPLSAVLGARIADEAGLPKGLLATVTGRGNVGWDLIDYVDMVSFTGSVETGRKIQIKCAEQLKPSTMELGGKDPMIVCRDANLERAANGCVWGALANSGQVCISIERVYVDESIHDDFVRRVVSKVGQLRQGAPDEDVDIGSMTSESQLKIVETQVEDARKKGAKILTGGRCIADRPGLWYEPTVITEVDNSMGLMREETFGPVIAIQKVKDESEALERANDSNFGLSASVWSKDKEGAMNIARRVEAGAVCINDHMIHMMIPEVSMGGIKESGVGHRHGAEGIRKFCQEQTLVIDRFGLKKEALWYPGFKNRARVFRRLLNLLFRSGLRNKFYG